LYESHDIGDSEGGTSKGASLRYRVSADVVSEVVDGEAVLLNLTSGVYFALNSVGTRVWQLVQEPRSAESLQSILLAEFEVAPDVLRADLATVLEDLLDRGLVERVPEQSDDL
jgi:hypothetical protein